MENDDLRVFNVSTNSPDIVYYESAIEYIADNTTLEVQNVSALPFCAKLFVQKYVEAMKRDFSVSSQSLSGMSQSFNNGNIDDIIENLARGLLGKYLKSSFQFIPMKRKW
ncbi:MAG: hypothetical protein NC110_06635 [Ruminococcus sp.]|nr:hypothetical protein [Ruminococcus sp.]